MASVKWDLQAYILDKQRKILILSCYHKPCVEKYCKKLRGYLLSLCLLWKYDVSRGLSHRQWMEISSPTQVVF